MDAAKNKEIDPLKVYFGISNMNTASQMKTKIIEITNGDVLVVGKAPERKSNGTWCGCVSGG